MLVTNAAVTQLNSRWLSLEIKQWLHFEGAQDLGNIQNKLGETLRRVETDIACRAYLVELSSKYSFV